MEIKEPIQKEEVLTEQEQPVVPAQPKADLQAGEKVFTIILCIIGALAFWQAAELWMKMSEPRIASAAALPLFVSGVWTLLSLTIVLENIKKTTPLTGKTQKGKLAVAYIFPRVVVIMIAAVLAYCIALLLGVSFYIVTPIFLWGTMTYLSKGNYVKNILWTAICMAFIYVVFRLVFSVVLP